MPSFAVAVSLIQQDDSGRINTTNTQKLDTGSPRTPHDSKVVSPVKEVGTFTSGRGDSSTNLMISERNISPAHYLSGVDQPISVRNSGLCLPLSTNQALVGVSKSINFQTGSPKSKKAYIPGFKSIVNNPYAEDPNIRLQINGSTIGIGKS